MSTLVYAGMAINALGIVGLFTGRLIRRRHSCALLALGFGLYAIDAAVHGDKFFASLYAVEAALFAWFWWHGGGGDDTKRRLRSLAERFQPVRRTAPANT